MEECSGNITDEGGTHLLNQELDKLGSLFYLISPGNHVFKTVKECPDHIDKAMPYMVGLIFLEAVYNMVVRGKNINIADSITNMNLGITMVLGGIVSRIVMISTYSWLHQNYKLIDPQWDSYWIWIIAAIGVDFGYYWFHRASHEVSFLWAIHQVHHSSEEMNLSTAFRQPFLEGFGWVTHWFYLPCALLVPTTQMLVHSELNLMFQFWTHTEIIPHLGPLELIFNTASQHRVHHGANRYCIDKNYGGYLCIWDRLFGTFAEEKKNEDLVYGLVDQPQTYNIWKLNTLYFKLLHDKAMSFGSIKAWIFGPGWFPGLGRLGDVSTLPQAPQREKHVSKASRYELLIVIVNTLTAAIITDHIAKNYSGLGYADFYGLVLIALLSAYATGLILDNDDVILVHVIRLFVVLFGLSSELQPLISQIILGSSTTTLVLSSIRQSSSC